jgi:hypothetical protein
LLPLSLPHRGDGRVVVPPWTLGKIL